MTSEQFALLQGQLYYISSMIALLLAITVKARWVELVFYLLGIAFSVLAVFPGLRP